MADEKPPQFKTTLGLSMQRFGRSLMRHYKPSPAYNATPAPSSDAGAEVRPTPPYQQMSETEINWDGVIASKRNTGAPPPLDQGEMAGDSEQQGFVMRPRPAQQGQPVQRQAAPQRKAPPKRGSAPKKRDVAPRLQAILEGHKAKEETRDNVRIQRRQAWEEAQQKGVDEDVTPAIPGWKPKPRASFDYVETSALIKDKDEKPPKLTDSIADPAPIQREDEPKPKRKTKSNIVEMRDGEIPDIPAPSSPARPSLNMGDDFADTVPMTPVDSVTTAGESQTVQRQASDDAPVEESELGEFDLPWDAPLDDDEDFDDTAFDPRVAIEAMNSPEASPAPATESSQIQRTPDASQASKPASRKRPKADKQSKPAQSRQVNASNAETPSQAQPIQRQASPAEMSSIQRQASPAEAAEASSNEGDAWDDDESDFDDPVFDGIEAPIQRQADFAPANDAVLWDDDEPEFYPPAYDDGDNDDVGTMAESQAPVQRQATDQQAPVQRQATDSQAPVQRQATDSQTPVQRRAAESQAPVQRRNRKRDDNAGADHSPQEHPTQDTSRRRKSASSDAVPSIQRNVSDEPVSGSEGDFMAADDVYDDSGDNYGQEVGASFTASDSAPIVQRTMNPDGTFEYKEVSHSGESFQTPKQPQDLAAALGQAGMLEPASIPDETYDYHEGGEAPSGYESGTSQPSQPVVQRHMDEPGNSHYTEQGGIPSLPQQSMNLAEALQQAGIVEPDSVDSPDDSIQREADFNPGAIPADVRQGMLQRMRDKSMESMSNLRQQQETIEQSSQENHSDTPPGTVRANVPRTPPTQLMRDPDAGAFSGASASASMSASASASASMSASASASNTDETPDKESEEDIEKLTHDVYRRLRRRLRDEVDKYNRK